MHMFNESIVVLLQLTQGTFIHRTILRGYFFIVSFLAIKTAILHITAHIDFKNMRMRSVFQTVQLPVLNQALLCIPVAVHTMGWLSGRWAKRQGVCVGAVRDMILESTQRQVVLRGAWKWVCLRDRNYRCKTGSCDKLHPQTYIQIHTPSPTPPPDWLSEPIHKTESKPPHLSVLYPSPPSLSLSVTTLFVSRCESSLQRFDLVFPDGLVFVSVWCKQKCLAR